MARGVLDFQVMRPGSTRRLLLCAVMSLASSASPAPSQRNTVEVWVRAPGSSSADAGQLQERTVDLAIAPWMEVDRFDAQYGARHRYRGVTLQWVLRAGSVPAAVDLALLHFDNGMVVPLPFRDTSAMERLAPFIAVEVWVESPGGAGWSRDLPDISKKGDESEDWRPIRFQGGKLVVQTLWHPEVPEVTPREFSPWQHVDRLAGVELAQSEAYRRQFQGSGSAAVANGYRVFSERCQFCHGVRQVGAHYGWDFAEPVPLHTYRDPHSLWFHAKYREFDATARGLMMPAFPDLGQTQAAALWAWMEAIVTSGPAPYRP
jgi:mono/diheme cytochrome c family protein